MRRGNAEADLPRAWQRFVASFRSFGQTCSMFRRGAQRLIVKNDAKSNDYIATQTNRTWRDPCAEYGYRPSSVTYPERGPALRHKPDMAAVKTAAQRQNQRVELGRLARSEMYHLSASTIAGFSPLA